MLAMRWLRRVLVGLGAILLLIGAQLNAWAGERDRLVRSGSPATPTTQFVIAGDGESLLAAGSDPRLRVTVDGDLATASHLAVLVPGVDTDASHFDGGLIDRSGGPVDWWKTMPGWARSLRQAAAAASTPSALSAQVADPDGDLADDVAVIAWM
ncbi:MAG: alpha/beta hydrolase family protein, partial [Bifidobacteriaceae bacterium]|nr:alpha/beta hydrolase family protein [Bifidobacteriaceae bacterium]